MHIATLLWGFTGILGRAISLSEYSLVLYRMGITALILLIILLITKQLSLPPTKVLKQFAGIGLLIAIHWVAFYGSIKYANASIALVCLSTSSLYSAILEPILFKRKVRLSEVLLSLMALAGMALIYKFEVHYTKGIIFGLAAAGLAAIFTLFNKKIVSEHPAQLTAFYEISSGFLFLIVISPIYTFYFPQANNTLQGLDWLWLLILSYFCTVLGQSLALSALKKISSFTAVLTVNLEPVYGIALAFIVFHENKDLSNKFYYGIALIAASVLAHTLLMYKANKRK
jgi:drug/metabolite transporter (DMT)-like permease